MAGVDSYAPAATVEEWRVAGLRYEKQKRRAEREHWKKLIARRKRRS
jgi:hypothetical protein